MERSSYLKVLEKWQDKPIIKVITGIRRCGKSTLLQQFQDRLLQQGVKDNQIIAINFEDLAFEDILDYRALYDYIIARLDPTQRMYIFLDEIQRVKDYEKAVDSLFLKDNVDIYITGSNSYIFSGELATHLRGRYIEISMLPLSFKEFHQANTTSKPKENFQLYLKQGGFPFWLVGVDDAMWTQYLQDIYNSVLLMDIEERILRKEKLTNTAGVDVLLLKNIAKYLGSVVGSPVSLRNITGYIQANERKVSINTISSYVEALCMSYLFYPMDAMDVVGKELLKSYRKYYIADLGLRRLMFAKRNYDLGFSIENIVFLELKRRGYAVYSGRIHGTEIDFVAQKDGQYTYFQVCASLVDEVTFDREIKPLTYIQDNYEKIILTLDAYSIGNYNGIKVMDVVEWLLSDESLGG